MKRAPMPRRRTGKPRRKPAVTCSTRSCSRRPAGNGLCVQHLEARADRLFSLWVRARDGRCTYPVYPEQPCGMTTALQAAHYIGRRNKAVRFDPDNVHALCSQHHVMVDQHGREHAKHDWILAVLGEWDMALLHGRARTPKDRITAALEALAWLEGDEG